MLLDMKGIVKRYSLFLSYSCLTIKKTKTRKIEFFKVYKVYLIFDMFRLSEESSAAGIFVLSPTTQWHMHILTG